MFRLIDILSLSSKIILLLILFLAFTSQIYSHLLDEVSVKTRIQIEKEELIFRIELAAGLLVSEDYLKILDPDMNKEFEREDILDFVSYTESFMKIEIDGRTLVPEIVDWEVSPLEDFLAGISSVNMNFTVPVMRQEGTDHSLVYENRMSDMEAIHTLHINAAEDKGITIVSEERNEFLQDKVTLVFRQDKTIRILPSQNKEKVEPVSIEYIVPAVGRVVDRIKEGNYSPRIMAIIIALAMFVGFLHAFTPGHGKALVGAYLIANSGTVFQAAALGLVVTISHTLSIYLFGGLASTATYFFLPSKVVPYMTIAAGFLIVFLGLWSFVRRVLGLEADHAHLLPNLKILKSGGVNILMDSSAADAVEYLTVAAEDDLVLNQMKDTSAEDVNICTPGCETHKMLPFNIQERQSFHLMRMAIETGAVDLVVSNNAQRKNKINKLIQGRTVELHSAPAGIDEARDILLKAVKNYAGRGAVFIPDDSFSWKKLISLGIAGGLVPCPDALAILIVSVSIGKIILGMGIVLSFSMGLSMALILIGVVVVVSKNMLSKNRWLSKVSYFIPYFSSLFISGLGGYMIVRSI